MTRETSRAHPWEGAQGILSMIASHANSALVRVFLFDLAISGTMKKEEGTAISAPCMLLRRVQPSLPQTPPPAPYQGKNYCTAGLKCEAGRENKGKKGEGILKISGFFAVGFQSGEKGRGITSLPVHAHDDNNCILPAPR